MGNPRLHPDCIQKDPRKFTLADWGHAYRKFVARQKFLKRWPFKTGEERKAAWREWSEITVYEVVA